MNDLLDYRGIRDQVAAQERRRKELGTPETRAHLQKLSLQAINVIQSAGYHLPEGTPIRQMAETWAVLLSEIWATYGDKTLIDAVLSFLRNDGRERKYFPTPADIIAEAKAHGVNPAAQLGKFEQQRREAALWEIWAAEFEERKRAKEKESGD